LAFLLPIAPVASIGFMRPVAISPKAIAFADPAVTRSVMLRAGALLDVVSRIVTVGLASVAGSFALA